ncbi:CHAP domain-containing protein [Tenacibaculum maritimum]|nr:CHAP domain-containing protein [Tenacibaculum maritimum]MDB0600694.1 CHAP domain-containing protein [Tenacibaculum maritimum]MDB0612677.1 CHAP domain-containing protein [Tenacibaculum maritimum]
MRNFIKTYKEELLALPLLIIALLVFKWFLNGSYPETAQFDLASETETIFWAIIKLIVFTSSAWFALRVVFPKSFSYLKNTFYQDFDNISCDEKRGLSLKIFFAFLFALVFLSSGFAQESQIRTNLQLQLESQLHIKEATGNNDGIAVEKYLASVGLSKGYPWCAAFTTWNLNAVNIPNPQSAWSPNWAKSKDQIWSRKLVKTHRVKSNPQLGDCFTIYYPKLQRVGHVGFYTGRASNGYFTTIEGNTNINGSRKGIGVFKRKRHPKKIYAITNYITPYYEANINTCNSNPTVLLQYNQRSIEPSKGYRFYKGKYQKGSKGFYYNYTSRFNQDKNSNRQAYRKTFGKEVKTKLAFNSEGGQLNRSNLFSRRVPKENRITRDNYNIRERNSDNSNSRTREKGRFYKTACKWSLLHPCCNSSNCSNEFNNQNHSI